MTFIAVGIPVVLFVIWLLSGYLPTRNIPMPSYTVIEKRTDYEIRLYDAYIIAETRQRSNDGSGGFNDLFRYISGNNASASRSGMTSSVLKSVEDEGKEIPMSAPVIKQGEGKSGVIAFVMPPGSTMEGLPQPKSLAVKLREVLPCKVAVVTFSGVASAGIIKAKTKLLFKALQRDGVQAKSLPSVALYNPPWTPPFMRRNEVMVELAETGTREG